MQPLRHTGVFLLKRLLKLLASGPHGVLVGPVREAIEEDLTNISHELLIVLILSAVHLVLDGAQVHWLRDLLEVVGYTILHRVDRLAERADQTSPETCAHLISARLHKRWGEEEK